MGMKSFKFGKWANYPIEEIPLDYLEWMRESTQKTLEMIDEEIGRRERAAMGTLSMAQRITEAGYRALAKQMHPDAGGNTRDMQELNATMEEMRRKIK